MGKLKYILSNAGKFHHFEVAKVLHQRSQLTKIICGYPWFKLKKEKIPKRLVNANGLLRIIREPFIGVKNLEKIDFFLEKLNAKNIDKVTCKSIYNYKDANVLLSLSTVGLKSGMVMKKNKKIYICERSSAHIVHQNELLKNEYEEYTNRKFQIDNWYIERELEEYQNADIILVPSTFVKNTFNQSHYSKIQIIEFGADIDNFFMINDENKSQKYFDILFIGAKSLRKGLHYLIEAFNKFKHPNKRLHIIGSNTDDKDFFDKKLNSENIIVYGHVPHSKMNKIINKCHLHVLPSIEDGFGLVVLQAAAAGCPSIVSENAGASDFIKKNNCGFVVPYKNSSAITEKIQLLADNKIMLNEMSYNAINSTKQYTWSNYVDRLDEVVFEFQKNR
jgi:alpha-maltose-1-phosphate synthase